ncbi:M20/M25/M40 family metallo-hydrolase [bacterium BMS3Abin03]|nr:M20/M25/M40 family metallo-hydrolase [bacterium BMS3Abin03]
MLKIKKHTFLFILLSLFIPIDYVYSQENDFLDEIINSCNIDSLTTIVKILSGETEFVLNNQIANIKSRHSSLEGNEIAAQFIKNKLNQLKLSVSEQTFSSGIKNIIAEQTGIDNSKCVIISAHYDCCGDRRCSEDSSLIAPGADDDGSGVATVLECARILSRYQTQYKIVYAFWDSEEQGLIGSRLYSNQAYANNKDIIGVINIDMIGWDSNDDGLIEIHEKDTSATNFIDLPGTIISINQEYNIGLNPLEFRPGTRRSDHNSFWQNGFNAILLIEGLYSEDFNEYYHSQNDKLGNFNLDYYARACKLAIGSLAQIAIIKNYLGEIPDDYIIYQNYPNPFNAQTKIKYSITNDGFVSINVFNILGQSVEKVVSEFQRAGSYNITYNTAPNLSSGIYIYTLTINGRSKSNKMIYIK